MEYLRKQNWHSGFTLVELMIVVSIVGILSAIAIPNFRAYQAKAKTSEAKLQLSAVYSALTALQSDYEAYASCLEDAGYTASGDNNYYAVGMADNSIARELVKDNGGACDKSPHFDASRKVAGVAMQGAQVNSIDTSDLTPTVSVSPPLATPNVDDTGSYFVVGAIGVIDPNNSSTAKASKWAINQDKVLREINRGY